MKKTKNILKILVLIMVIFFFNACSRQMSESVIDQKADLNGGFECVRNELPVNWQLYTEKTAGSGDFDLELDRSEFKEGKQSLKYTVRKCSDKGGRFSPGISQEIPVRPGEIYHISFWIKNKDTEFTVKISGVSAFSGSEGPSLHSSDSMEEWRQFTYEYKIPPGMQALRFEVSILKPGKFRIDDIKIDKLTDASPAH